MSKDFQREKLSPHPSPLPEERGLEVYSKNLKRRS